MTKILNEWSAYGRRYCCCWGKPLKSNDKLHRVSCDFDSNSFSYKWKVLTGESEVTSELSFAQLSYLFHSARQAISFWRISSFWCWCGRPVIPQCECSVESINFGEAKQQLPTAFALRRWMRQTAEQHKFVPLILRPLFMRPESLSTPSKLSQYY